MPARIFPSAAPKTAQISTIFPEGRSWLLSRILPLYFSSAPVPAGLNPHAILCVASCDGLFSVQINTEYAKQWPNITVKRDGPADGKEFEGMTGKFEKFFSPKPGEGD